MQVLEDCLVLSSLIEYLAGARMIYTEDECILAREVAENLMAAINLEKTRYVPLFPETFLYYSQLTMLRGELEVLEAEILEYQRLRQVKMRARLELEEEWRHIMRMECSA